MGLRNRLATALFVISLTIPAAAAPRDFESVLVKFKRLVVRILHLPPVTNGDGLIPPIPGPKPGNGGGIVIGMRRKRVSPLRRVVDWMVEGQVQAEPLVHAVLALPAPERDAWLSAHPEARIVQFFEGLIHAAEADLPNALALTEFVVRHVDSAPLPPETSLPLTVVRGHAWKARALALQAAALQAYERSAAIFREEPLAQPELEEVERAAAPLRPRT